jgi:nitroreductase
MNSENELTEQSNQLLGLMKKRRTVRAFSKRKISRQIIENCIAVAGTAPSGANMQPWTFILVEDQKLKRKTVKKPKQLRNYFMKKKFLMNGGNNLNRLIQILKRNF